MKKALLIVILASLPFYSALSQVGTVTGAGIIFQGIVRDANSLLPLPNSQIYINRAYSTASDAEGAFAFIVNRKDTVIFTLLGYKPAKFLISDTLAGREFNVGVFLTTDTVSIAEVIIIPRLASLKSDLFNAPAVVNPEIENARYNLEIATYQAKVGQGRLGDPSSNYELLRQQQRTDAFEKGGIPSSRIVGITPFSVIPVIYSLLKGLPGKPAPMKSHLTRQEVDQINKKYLESIHKKE